MIKAEESRRPHIVPTLLERLFNGIHSLLYVLLDSAVTHDTSRNQNAPRPSEHLPVL